MKNFVSLTTWQWFLVGFGLSICLSVTPAWTTGASAKENSVTPQNGQGRLLVFSASPVGYIKDNSELDTSLRS